MKKPDTKETIELLKNNWERVYTALYRTRETLKFERSNEKIYLDQLDGLLRTFDILGERPEGIRIPPELQFRSSKTIGDAMEEIIKEKGAQTKKDIAELLIKANFIKNPKNARIVVANAIAKDGRKRFCVIDGKVILKIAIPVNFKSKGENKKGNP
jgi:hypothetical protein